MNESLDLELLTQLMVDFESGKDFSDENPFDPERHGMDDELRQVAFAFVEGNVVPETRKWIDVLAPVGGGTEQERAAAYALGGILQGLLLGVEYTFMRRR